MSAARPPGRQLPWFLLTGVVIGFVVGLAWAWWGDPVQYQNISPAGLSKDYRADLRALVVLAYAANDDVGRARARLDLLGDRDMIGALEDQATRLQQEDLLPEVSNAMLALADELRASTVEEPGQPAAQETLPTGENTQAVAARETNQPAGVASATRPPAVTLSPALTLTPRPTQTASATPGAPFTLVENAPTCEPARPGLMAIAVLDAAGQEAAGIPILVTWPGGQDLFFTGLAPEIGPGYADFVMSTGLTYTVRVGEDGAAVSELEAQDCPSGLGGLNLTFRQP